MTKNQPEMGLERVSRIIPHIPWEHHEAFGGSLLWLREARSPEQPFPYHSIAWTIACPGLRELDRESWSAVQSQMIDALVRLERAVVPYLQRWLEED